jgi:copper oxidase (laccase) domain-containing protein
VITNTVATMRREWGADPADLLVAAGPSLCTDCADFTDPVRELPSIDKKFFFGRCADLRAIAEAQFAACGVDTTRIDRHPGCTRCSPEAFWSYRADKDGVRKGGRNLLACMLKNAR